MTTMCRLRAVGARAVAVPTSRPVLRGSQRFLQIINLGRADRCDDLEEQTMRFASSRWAVRSRGKSESRPGLLSRSARTCVRPEADCRSERRTQHRQGAPPNSWRSSKPGLLREIFRQPCCMPGCPHRLEGVPHLLQAARAGEGIAEDRGEARARSSITNGVRARAPVAAMKVSARTRHASMASRAAAPSRARMIRARVRCAAHARIACLVRR